jgi:hypothetical protein
MAGHSRSKNGVASLAYVPAIHVFLDGGAAETWMPAFAGMTESDELPHIIRYSRIFALRV